MVSTNLMANYMKRYPKLILNWSTTTDFGKDVPSQIKKINELSAKNLVVVPYEYNNKPELLQQFEHPENLEVFLNEHCKDNCPFRREHWRAVNEAILSRRITSIELAKISCRLPDGYIIDKYPKHFILREQLPLYDTLGIRHFKISGRIEPDIVMDAYMEHFVRRGKETDVKNYISQSLQHLFLVMKKRLFSIPDANSRIADSGEYNVRIINRGILACMQEHADWFYDDFQVETAYGCPGSCIWNGNRPNGEVEEFDDGWAKAVLGMYAKYGIKYRVTFTNFLWNQRKKQMNYQGDKNGCY